MFHALISVLIKLLTGISLSRNQSLGMKLRINAYDLKQIKMVSRHEKSSHLTQVLTWSAMRGSSQRFPHKLTLLGRGNNLCPVRAWNQSCNEKQVSNYFSTPRCGRTVPPQIRCSRPIKLEVLMTDGVELRGTGCLSFFLDKSRDKRRVLGKRIMWTRE